MLLRLKIQIKNEKREYEFVLVQWYDFKYQVKSRLFKYECSHLKLIEMFTLWKNDVRNLSPKCPSYIWDIIRTKLCVRNVFRNVKDRNLYIKCTGYVRNMSRIYCPEFVINMSKFCFFFVWNLQYNFFYICINNYEIINLFVNLNSYVIYLLN